MKSVAWAGVIGLMLLVRLKINRRRPFWIKNGIDRLDRRVFIEFVMGSLPEMDEERKGPGC